jgi:hypothetical protein
MAVLLGAWPRIHAEPGGTEFHNSVAPILMHKGLSSLRFLLEKIQLHIFVVEK